jgi:hypothetical protein
MKMALYAVFDRGIAQFGAPIMSQNELMMKRSLSDLFAAEAGRPELERHQYVRYAESFDLYLIGEYESDNGVVSPLQPVMLYRLADFKGA